MSQSMNEEKFWVGVDISKASFDASFAPIGAVPSQWAKLPSAQFTMDSVGVSAFEQWLSERAMLKLCVGVCIESTGIYSHRFVQHIAALALPEVAMVNPALPLAFRKSLGLRDKCDRVDAAVLALFGTINRPRPNTKSTPEYRHLKAMWRLYEDYTEDVLRWKNRLEQSLEESVMVQIQATIQHLEEKQKETWEVIEQSIDKQPLLKKDMELMCSIPGVGAKTAAVILAELGDLRTWSRKQLVSYAGLYPKVYASGTSVLHKPTLAKGGGKRLRKALFLPACSATRHNKPLAQWRQGLLERGKPKMSTIGAVMRKLLTVIRGVVISGEPFNPEKLRPKNT